MRKLNKGDALQLLCPYCDRTEWDCVIETYDNESSLLAATCVCGHCQKYIAVWKDELKDAIEIDGDLG